MNAMTNFLWGYWAFAEYMLAALGAISLMMMTVMRRRAKGISIFVVGVYVTMAYYAMASYRSLDVSMEFALGAVVLSGLAVGSGFYYFFFVRAE